MKAEQLKKLVETSMNDKVYMLQHTPASEVWHPCERRLVLLRKTPLPIKVIKKYEVGKEFEKIAIQRISNFVKIKTCQYEVVNEDLDLKGVIDVVLEDGNFIEIKSTASDDIILSVDNMLQNQLTRKYLYQVQTYLLLMKRENCILYLIDRRTGEDHFYDISRDEAVIEEITERAIHVKEHLQKQTLPKPIEYYDLCRVCYFYQQCYLDEQVVMKEIQVSPDLQEMLEKYYAIKEKLKKYKQLEEKLKEVFKEWDSGVYRIGDKVIKISEYQRTFYNIPEEIKKQYAEVRFVKRIQF